MERKPPKGKSIAEVNPELAKQWNPDKNGDLTPFDISIGSTKSVWWKCEKGEDHEWQVSPNNRTKAGCPICTNKKVVKSNSLGVINPELAKQWHPTKNENLTPLDVSPVSGKKAWWECPMNNQHSWLASVAHRANGRGCPYCVNKKINDSNSLQFLYPEIAKEWIQEKNSKTKPSDVAPVSGKKYWWKCPKGDDHIWFASVANRTRGRGCPICTGHKVAKSTSIAKTNPKLLKEWHFEKNIISPFEVSKGSEKVVWWKCIKVEDHEWQAPIFTRVLAVGCPVCSGKRVVESTSLKILSPKLSSEWHPTKNGKITPQKVTLKSNKKVWWKCQKGDDHEWKATISNRTAGNGCPFCTLTPQSRQELQITFELKQFFDINPKGFKTRVQGKLWSIDIYIHELNLGVEFDGSYWHKDKRDLDKLKTEKLNAEGFQIMRIREEPLKPITEIDVVSKLPFNAKQVANDILDHIIRSYYLDTNRAQKISRYLKQKGLKNEKALDEYIEMILDEKSKKTKKAPQH